MGYGRTTFGWDLKNSVIGNYPELRLATFMTFPSWCGSNQIHLLHSFVVGCTRIVFSLHYSHLYRAEWQNSGRHNTELTMNKNSSRLPSVPYEF